MTNFFAGIKLTETDWDRLRLPNGIPLVDSLGNQWLLSVTEDEDLGLFCQEVVHAQEESACQEENHG